MIIPCIDLQGGKVVQLVQGEKVAIELESVDDALAMFQGFPLLHVIDLDAAKGDGDNDSLIRDLLARVAARVGGGVRSVGRAQELLAMGAKQVIVGTRAFRGDGVDTEFLGALSEGVGADRVIVAVDVKGGQVAVHGWRETLALKPGDVMGELSPYCAGFLCTYVDKEGTMGGTDLSLFRGLRGATDKVLIAAGGIASLDEVRALVEMDVEVALGMAVYSGRLDIESLRDICVNTSRG